MAFELLLLLSLILLSGFFSATETALFSFSHAQILGFRKSENKRLKLVAAVMKDPNQVLTSLLLGNNGVNIMVILVANRMLQRFLWPPVNAAYESFLRFAAEVLCIASILLVFGEIIPKSVALKHPQAFVRITIFPFFLFHELIGVLRIRFFIASISEKLVNAVRRIFGDKEEYANPGDIQLAVEMSKTSGHLSQEEASMVGKILELKDVSLSKIMLDRSLVKTVFPYDSVKNAIHLASSNRISNLPVYDRKKDAVVGVFEVKRAILENQKGQVQDFMTEPYFVPMVNASEKILDMMLNKRANLAVIIDEFGTYAGIISSQHILDYLTQSTIKSREDPHQDGFFSSENGLYINANVKLEKIEGILKCSFPKGDYQTLGGFLITRTGRVPKEKEWLVVEGMKIYIDQARPNKIVRVFIQQKGTQP